ncbi:MAG: V-type ATPase 116kDa subunit family protein [Sphaerochaetaceae bacterium]
MNVFTVPMKLMTAVVLDETTDRVMQELLALGVVDFIEVKRLAPKEASHFHAGESQENSQEFTDLRLRIETLFSQGNIPIPASEKLDPKTMESLSLSEGRGLVERMMGELASIRERQKQISQKKIRVEELWHYVEGEKLNYIDLHIGKTAASKEVIKRNLEGNAYQLLNPQGWDDMVILTLQRDRAQINRALDTLQWEENPDSKLQKPALLLLEEHLREKLNRVEEDNEKIKGEVGERIRREQSNLEKLWSNLRLQELVGKMGSKFSYTRNTSIFSGRVPAQEVATVEEAVMEASGGKCVIEWIEAENMPRHEVPTAVKEVPLLRPFQRLVDNYDTVEYGTINPTPFVALSYMAMFGLMFADAGQGLIIALIGLFGTRYYRDRKPLKKGLIDPGLYQLFIYLGISSIITGVLFGSYFGYPLLPPLWFNYHAVVEGEIIGGRTIYSILGITIYFGVIIIFMGLILNWINLIRKRSYLELVWSKNGVLAGWIFGWGVWAGSYFVKSNYKSFPSGSLLPIVFIIPLVLLLFKIPLYRMRDKRLGKKVESKGVASIIMESLLEWVVDVLEIFSGFLANTLSFMRVAGLGIAHVSLMVAFDQMAALVGGGVPGVLVLVVGNALVIALEGLSAGIQALRLNYYEFFTKYFTGNGLSYNPVSLRYSGEREGR